MSNEIAEVIEQVEERFLEIAPRELDYASEKGFAIQLLKGNDYLMKVAQEQPQSLQMAMSNVAAIGLSLSPAEKLAYLVPRKGKICLDVSYQGFCRLGTNSGSIEWVQAELVYSNDKFMQSAMGERPDHSFDGFATVEQRGDFKGGYCVAKTRSGDYLTTVMSAEEIYKIRDNSELYKKNKSGPWADYFKEMAKKSVVRRAFKMWPRTDEHALKRMAQAVEISNQNEGFEPIVNNPNIRDFTLEQKAYLDQMIEKSDSTGMAAFRSSLDEGVFTNLYHSFEKGTKGKFQGIIDKLVSEGMDELKSCSETINEASQANDDVVILEAIGERSEEEMSVIKNFLSDDALGIIKELAEQE